MKTFMIQYVLTISEYEQDRSKRENHTILIKADDDVKAQKTLDAYWEKKSDEFGTSYSVGNVEIIPSIKQEDYLPTANPENDEFICTDCLNRFDIEDSIQKDGHLYCEDCANKIKM